MTKSTMAAPQSFLDEKKMHRDIMLAKIEDVLKRGTVADAPAYTLILGAGASFGVVPTAKEMLGFPDIKTKKIHHKCIPIWLAEQLDPTIKFDGDAARLECTKQFWRDFQKKNNGNKKFKSLKIGADDLPVSTSIAAGYQSVFDTGCVGGLDTPERHRNYMRAVTMAIEDGSTLLNATHFYLASLLSLQRRRGDLGVDKRPLYTGKREFVRTIFTTNFDPLLQTSLQLFQLLYYMTDRPEFLSADALQTDHHPAIHLFYAHGSVHRPYMANTDEQIALLKQQNARDLAAYLASHGVIVLGYSGWDDCLLDALNQTKTFSNNLYWLARGSDSISPEVANFLKLHPNAYWVEIDDGGNFMAELHGRLCPGAPNTEMLYNPIRPLLCQLGCVSLTGVKGSAFQRKESIDSSDAVLDHPTDVETIRIQVIERLQDVQKLFIEQSSPGMELQEVERQADLSYANDDWDTALKGYNSVLKRKSHLSPERQALAFYRRGYCHQKKKDLDKAIEDYTTVINFKGLPSHQIAKSLVNRAAAYRENGQFDSAIEDCNKTIAIHDAPIEQIAKARIIKAVCHDDRGNSALAAVDLRKILEMKNLPPAIVTSIHQLIDIIESFKVPAIQTKSSSRKKAHRKPKTK